MIEYEWTRRQHSLSKFSWKLDGRRREYTCRLANSAFVTKTKFAKLMRLLAKGSWGRASKACARRKIRLRERKANKLSRFISHPVPSPFQMRPASFPARWGPRSRPRATTAGGSAARSAATSGWPAARAAAAALAAAAATGTSTGPRRRTCPSRTLTPPRRATSRRSSARRPSSPAW